MPNTFEGLPSGPQPEKLPSVEKFQDFDLDIGDDIYRNTGSRYRILAITFNDASPGGGTFEIERYASDNTVSRGAIIYFQALVDTQADILKIDRARMPEGVVPGGRDNGQLTQLDRLIQDPATPPPEVAAAKLKRAAIYRRLRPLVSDDEDTIRL